MVNLTKVEASELGIDRDERAAGMRAVRLRNDGEFSVGRYFAATAVLADHDQQRSPPRERRGRLVDGRRARFIDG